MDHLEIDIAVPRRAFTVRLALRLEAETVAILGPSGAGKSTLLRAIAGLEAGCAGRISLGASTWLDTSRGIDLRSEQRRVGYLPQEYGLFPHLTVAGNVRFAARRERPDLLAQLGIAHLAGVRPHLLSGGERQRAALARALAREPQLLLLDEPFSAVDALTRRRLRDELADFLARLELPVLLVTHSFEDAAALASRVAVIDRGEVVQRGVPDELLDTPASPVVAGLIGANVLAGTAVPGATGTTIHLDGGGELPSTASASGPVLIVVAPWKLTIGDPAASPLTDTVRGIHRDGGVARIRLTRLSVHVPAGQTGTITEGMPVGVRARPEDVRILPGEAG